MKPGLRAAPTRPQPVLKPHRGGVRTVRTATPGHPLQASPNDMNIRRNHPIAPHPRRHRLFLCSGDTTGIHPILRDKEDRALARLTQRIEFGWKHEGYGIVTR